MPRSIASRSRAGRSNAGRSTAGRSIAASSLRGKTGRTPFQSRTVPLTGREKRLAQDLAMGRLDTSSQRGKPLNQSRPEAYHALTRWKLEHDPYHKGIRPAPRKLIDFAKTLGIDISSPTKAKGYIADFLCMEETMQYPQPQARIIYFKLPKGKWGPQIRDLLEKIWREKVFSYYSADQLRMCWKRDNRAFIVKKKISTESLKRGRSRRGETMRGDDEKELERTKSGNLKKPLEFISRAVDIRFEGVEVHEKDIKAMSAMLPYVSQNMLRNLPTGLAEDDVHIPMQVIEECEAMLGSVRIVPCYPLALFWGINEHTWEVFAADIVEHFGHDILRQFYPDWKVKWIRERDKGNNPYRMVCYKGGGWRGTPYRRKLITYPFLEITFGRTVDEIQADKLIMAIRDLYREKLRGEFEHNFGKNHPGGIKVKPDACVVFDLTLEKRYKELEAHEQLRQQVENLANSFPEGRYELLRKNRVTKDADPKSEKITKLKKGEYVYVTEWTKIGDHEDGWFRGRIESRSLREVHFDPGRSGIHCFGSTVNDIEEGSQADKQNVPTGWKVVEVDGYKVDNAEEVPELLQSIEDEQRPYTVTFKGFDHKFSDADIAEVNGWIDIKLSDGEVVIRRVQEELEAIKFLQPYLLCQALGGSRQGYFDLQRRIQDRMLGFIRPITRHIPNQTYQSAWLQTMVRVFRTVSRKVKCNYYNDRFFNLTKCPPERLRDKDKHKGQCSVSMQLDGTKCPTPVFTWSNKKHNCMICGRVICELSSTQKAYVREHWVEPVRCCDECVFQLTKPHHKLPKVVKSPVVEIGKTKNKDMFDVKGLKTKYYCKLEDGSSQWASATTLRFDRHFWEYTFALWKQMVGTPEIVHPEVARAVMFEVQDDTYTENQTARALTQRITQRLAASGATLRSNASYVSFAPEPETGNQHMSSMTSSRSIMQPVAHPTLGNMYSSGSSVNPHKGPPALGSPFSNVTSNASAVSWAPSMMSSSTHKSEALLQSAMSMRSTTSLGVVPQKDVLTDLEFADVIRDLPGDPRVWSVEEVKAFVTSLDPGMAKSAVRLAECHVDGKKLLGISRKELKESGVKKSIRRKLVLNSIARLKKYLSDDQKAEAADEGLGFY